MVQFQSKRSVHVGGGQLSITQTECSLNSESSDLSQAQVFAGRTDATITFCRFPVKPLTQIQPPPPPSHCRISTREIFSIPEASPKVK